MSKDEDMREELTEDDDLLSILSDKDLSDNTPNLLKPTNDEESEMNSKMQDIKELANTLQEKSTGGNPGSGDLDIDLSNWFNGKDVLPSDELNMYNTNSIMKMSYGLSRHSLKSYELMGRLGNFLNDSFDMLFSESAIMALDPEDILDRVKVAFTMYKELGRLNQKTYNDIIEQKNRWNTDSGDIDRLAMLLASIPSEKLQSILEEISFDRVNKDK
jgi:hypothetical protein